MGHGNPENYGQALRLSKWNLGQHSSDCSGWDATEASLGLHLSDEKTLVVEGRSAVEGLIELLSRVSMVLDGTPLGTALALGKKLPVSEVGATVSE